MKEHDWGQLENRKGARRMTNEGKERLKELLMEVLDINQPCGSLEIKVRNGCIFVDEYRGADHVKHLYYSPRFHGWNDDEDE